MAKESILTALCSAVVAAILLIQPVRAQVPDTSAWVRFSTFSYSGKAISRAGKGEYLNPIVAGFYPDPSICRVGNDYYLVNSSFQYFPGLPIWHSKDLVHWKQIGNIIDRPSQYPMHGGAVSAGMYAPTIRFHDGKFYVVCTLVGGSGNFYVSATDPNGPWSDPVVLPRTGGIDSSFFFDDDGKCYVTNCDSPVGAAEYNGHRTIRLQEVDLSRGQSTGEQTVIVNGGTDLSKHPIWCEGPHIYKIGGKYYLMCAQGGTSTDHSEVVFGSDKLRGPYVPADTNPILTARGLPNNRENPVTCTGHADLVQTQKGDWYAVFLGCQPYRGSAFNTGRQTFLLPVSWKDGWPMILPPNTPVPLSVKLPTLTADTADSQASAGDISYTDNFDSDRLDLRWIGLRAPQSSWHAISKSEQALFLEPRSDLLSGQGNPSYLAVRQQNNAFSCSVTLSAQPGTTDCTAGLAAFQNEGHFYALSVKTEQGQLTQIALEQPQPQGRDGQPASQPSAKPATVLAEQKLPAGTTFIELKIEADGPAMRCSYRIGNGNFSALGGELASTFLSTDVAGGFQGVTIGVFAHK